VVDGAKATRRTSKQSDCTLDTDQTIARTTETIGKPQSSDVTELHDDDDAELHTKPYISTL